MTSRAMIRNHIRSNIVGYFAVFLTLSGTAIALDGSNTVFSDDITDGEVKSADLATNAIRTTEIGPEQVRNADLGAGAVGGVKVADLSLTGSDLANDSLGSSKVAGLNGSDVQDDGLTGADVAEGTLGQVPLATVAGTGRHAWNEAVCDPSNASFVTCTSFATSLPAQGRLLLDGYGWGWRATLDGSTGPATGMCRLGVISGGTLQYYGEVEARASTENTGFPSFTFYHVGGEFDITAVTPPVGPGVVTVSVGCNETSSNIVYQLVGVSAVQIGAA
jgi:hypothetical protein